MLSIGTVLLIVYDLFNKKLLKLVTLHLYLICKLLILMAIKKIITFFIHGLLFYFSYLFLPNFQLVLGYNITGRKEGNILFNNTLNTFYLWLHGVRPSG